MEARYLNFQNVFDKFQSETDGGRQLINQLALANALLKWVYFLLLKIYFRGQTLDNYTETNFRQLHGLGKNFSQVSGLVENNLVIGFRVTP